MDNVYDLIGKELFVGDLVVAREPVFTKLHVYKILTLIDSGINGYVRLTHTGLPDLYLQAISVVKYPDSPEATIFLLKNNRNGTYETHDEAGFDCIRQPLAVGHRVIDLWNLCTGTVYEVINIKDMWVKYDNDHNVGSTPTRRLMKIR